MESKKIPKRKKAILIFLALAVALVATAAIAYSRYLHPTGAIVPGLYAVRTGGSGSPMVNFFLLQAGEKYIAVDAGADNIRTENELNKLGISAGDVIAVFITHSDLDHIGSLDMFSNATVYTGNTENSQFPDIPHQIMADSEIVELSGIAIKCIYTPGHTIDSVCYLIDGKYLFAGDLFISPRLSRYSEELQIENQENVLGINEVEYVFTGHFGLFKNAGFFRWWW